MVLVEGGFFKIAFPPISSSLSKKHFDCSSLVLIFYSQQSPENQNFSLVDDSWLSKMKHAFGLNTNKPFLEQHFDGRNIVFGKILKKDFFPFRQLRSAFWRRTATEATLKIKQFIFSEHGLPVIQLWQTHEFKIWTPLCKCAYVGLTS